MSDRLYRDAARGAIPLTRTCPECQEEMELITADDVGEVLVYECPECGSQEETHIEHENDDDNDETALAGPDMWLDDDAEVEPDQDHEPDDAE